MFASGNISPGEQAISLDVPVLELEHIAQTV
jgi:hypothetical protein